jgi:hypothetical protein
MNTMKIMQPTAVPVRVVVTLSAEDYRKAKLATIGDETVAEWVRSLVNTALKP